ncbi:MAG TPA: alpha/beta hydrolase [Kofleriaceae bacterium]|nr:alpha/beta hydrolase [Kofleriaceae bacterium]
MSLRSTITLARWLGPWADATKQPQVAITDDALDGMRVRVYRPHRRARGTFLIAPGLHYAGADDPRLDRFCRILAASGQVVVAPFIPDYLALVPSERAKADFARAFDALPRWSDHARPVVFSISFGSLLAFALAAERGDAIERLVIFGGYADLRETLQFCLTGSIASGRQAARDPLNQPVVLMNLLHLLDCADREAVVTGWRAYVERTWGRPEMKARERFVAVAEELAPSVPAAVRELFLVGIGVTPGADKLALAALERFDGRALDPTPYLPHVTIPVELVHGIDDDVIPYEHAHALGRQLPNARVHLTGLYGHTGTSKLALSAIARELATMVRVLRVLS